MYMKDKSLRFKTNINCGGCIAKVTPYLNATEGISQWEVDISNKDKILSVLSEGVTEAVVIQKVQEAGFRIERLEEFG